MMPPMDLNLLSHTPARDQILNDHFVADDRFRLSTASKYRTRVRSIVSRLRAVRAALKAAGVQQGFETKTASR